MGRINLKSDAEACASGRHANGLTLPVLSADHSLGEGWLDALHPDDRMCALSLEYEIGAAARFDLTADGLVYRIAVPLPEPQFNLS